MKKKIFEHFIGIYFYGQNVVTYFCIGFCDISAADRELVDLGAFVVDVALSVYFDAFFSNYLQVLKFSQWLQQKEHRLC